MISPWLFECLYAFTNFSYIELLYPCFIKSEDGSRVMKSEIVSENARTALAWDWRFRE